MALLPLKDHENKGGGLRSVPGLKLFVISFVWAFTTGFLPAIWNGEPGTWWLIERFFWTMALTIPFDVRDVKLMRKALRRCRICWAQETAST